jgi:hypothetical protein
MARRRKSSRRYNPKRDGSPTRAEKKAARRASSTKSSGSSSVPALMREYDLALDKYLDDKISKGKMTSIAKRCVAGGCPKHRMDDLIEFIPGAWGDRY